MITENPDVLDRLRAANIAPEDDPAPPLAQTRQRIEVQRRPRLGALRRGAVPRAAGWRVRRVAMLGAAAAATAVVVTLGAASGPSQHGGSAPLGVLQAAAATAKSNPASARFSGYVAETHLTMRARSGTAALTERTWRIVRPVSGTEFEGRLESLHPAPSPGPAPAAAKHNQGRTQQVGDAVRTSRREGDQVRDVYSWRQPYGTLFLGAPAPGGHPVPVPTDPEEAARAVASWAAGDVPADADKGFADLLKDSADNGTERALNYAENVLTAPRVSPDVRAAVYAALGRLTDVRIDPHATDPLGRPAAALTTEIKHGPTHTRFEMLFDPATARVLGERHVYTVDPGADPRYGEGSDETSYRYDEG